MVAAAVAAVLPSEPSITSFADIFGAAAGAQMGFLTPQSIAYNQMLAAGLNSNAAQFYTHSLFPWQIPTMPNYSPPMSPISHLAYKADKIDKKESFVSTPTSTAALDEANEHGKLSARKTSNFTKNRNQGLYQPYSSLNSSPTGSTSSISPGPASPSTSNSSGSFSPPSSLSFSPLIQSAASNGRKAAAASSEKTFKCQLCHRSFKYKHVLQNHLRIHTGEKPYGCTECGKRFTRDHHLKTHIRLHTGERPYQCKHLNCGQTFVQVANLRRHFRVHAGKNQPARQRTYENALSTIALESASYGVALDLSVETGFKNDLNAAGVGNRRLEMDTRGIVWEPKSMEIERLKISEEQSEPEDLSMHSSRLDSSTSPSDEDIDDLDDAATLNRKLQANNQAHRKNALN